MAKKTSKVIGYLVCTMQYPDDEEVEVFPDKVLAYHRDVENAMSQLTDVAGLEPDEVGDVDEVMGEDGRVWWQERSWFEVREASAFESGVARIVAAIRELGILDDHAFQVEKHVLKGDDDREIDVWRVEPTGDVEWTRIDFVDWRDG